MLRNYEDFAYIENCMSRCTSTYMSAASQKTSGRYLLNSGLCTTYGLPAGRTPSLISVLCYYITTLDHRSNIII